jgi:hypothetical protein
LTIQIERAGLACRSWAMVGSATLAIAPSITAALVAEQLAFEQGLRDRGTIDCDERSLGTAAVPRTRSLE